MVNRLAPFGLCSEQMSRHQQTVRRRQMVCWPVDLTRTGRSAKFRQNNLRGGDCDASEAWPNTAPVSRLENQLSEESATSGGSGDGTPEQAGAAGASLWHSTARILGVILLILALTFVVFTRLELARTKVYLEHDEAISVLGATGHDIPFETARVALSDHWVPVSEWQRYMRIENPLDFVSVERGVAQTDVAPPLYYWLLHIWLWAFGSSTTTPMLLNIPIAILTAFAIVGLVRRVTGSFTLGAAAALGWSLTPPAWTLSNMARQYDLLALCSVAVVWLVLRFLDEDASRVWDTVLLGLAVAAGMLTQYYFAITAVSIVIVVLVAASRRKAPHLVGRLALAVGLAMVLFFALNPDCFHAVRNMQNRLPGGPTVYAFRQRVIQVIGTFAPGSQSQVNAWLVSPHRIGPASFGLRFIAAMAAVLLLGLLAFVIAHRDWFKRFSFESRATIFVALWTSGVTLVLYLAFVSPPWAMADRYMAAAWALGAPATVVALNALPRRFVTWAVAVWVGLMFWASLLPISRIALAPSGSLGDLSGVHHVIIDTNRRGYVARYMLALPGNAEMYVGNEPDLAANPGPWLSRLQSGDLYVHIPGVSGSNPVPLADVMTGRFRLEPIPDTTAERLANWSQ